MYEGKLFHAIQFISHKHCDQKRKCFGYPYVTHPLMVFHMVSQHSDDQAVHIAALLHDIVEDTDTSLAEIKQEFGPKVAEYVDYLTEDKNLEWIERKEKYTKGFVGAPREVLLIKAADILYNLTDTMKVIERYPNDPFSKNIHEEIWLIQKKKVLDVIGKEWPKNPFLKKIDEVYTKLCTTVAEDNKKKLQKSLV